MITLVLVLAHLTTAAWASAFPSVPQLEASLGLRQGGLLPKMVAANGRGWNVYYQSGRALGNGHYDVRVFLQPVP